MNKKIIIGVIGLIPVLLHLAYWVAVSPAANYYLTIDEYATRAANPTARIGGQVVPGSIRWDNATRTLHFQVAGDRATINVVYRGIAPDAFRDGVTAILDGTRMADGAFVATGILVKCPHQYLPAG